MNLCPTHLEFHLRSPCFSSTVFSSKVRVRRRRTKLEKKKLTVSCQYFENLFQNWIFQYPFVNSLELIAPALGVASGIALYLNRSEFNKNVHVSNTRDWILFTSPTPFNRFVLLRCPSIMFEGSELLEDLNDKLVNEDRHYVKLIGRKDLNGHDEKYEKSLVYQRTCLSTGDGGVISLDWPAKLDIGEKHGIDTTVLLVPGTTEGSMDTSIRSFVCELLKCGCFPVVMNPRGCAGSPLTTARLFSAADSDDICTAIQFINTKRPCNTMMAVGWGHGANMLTKYLAEVAERTPLTAATCIDNPFDLEDATRAIPCRVAVEQKLTSGLIDILQSNKELFQGRTKGFDVEKALSATSLRDFEREVSKVSYGFESLEEFYSKSSTRELIGGIKIPLLFIQSDDGMASPFSIPRSLVAKNAFTSMLLCSGLPSGTITSENSVLPGCQDFAMEWLTAVEFGLLKGRHPLLKDVDFAINPSADLALAKSRENRGVNKFLNVTEIDDPNGHHVDSLEYQETDNEGAESQQSENHEEQNVSDAAALVSGSDDAAAVSGSDEAADKSAESDRSEVLQSAQVVMNMLDVTMPGTLGEEQKKKVLTAMEQGETLKNALEGAVPEDVRGNLTTAVSEIVKNQGTNLNLHGILNIPLVSNTKSNIQDTFKELSSAAVGSDDVGSPEKMKLGDGLPDDTDKKESRMEKPHQEQEESSKRGTARSPLHDESGSGTDSTLNKHSKTEKADGSTVDEQVKVIEGDDTTQKSSKETNGNQSNEEVKMDVSDDQNMSNSSTTQEETLSPETPTSEEPAPSLPNQGLESLTGVDDSTQVAVNSVFGVVENVINKLEEENDGKHDDNKDG